MNGFRRSLVGLAGLESLLLSIALVGSAHADSPNTWITVAPMPAGRYWPAVASAAGELYVFGGNGCEPIYPVCPTFYAYDPQTNTWARAGEMPDPLIGPSSATTGHDGAIYLYGIAESSGTAAFWRYDPDNKTWHDGEPPPNIEDSAQLVSGQDGRIYAVGGEVNGTVVGTLSAFDPATQEWSMLAPNPSPRQDSRAVAGPDGHIYVIGGFDMAALGTANMVEVYDPRTNSWSNAPPMPTSRTAFQAVTGPDGRIYTLGGDGKCFTVPCNVVEVFDVHSNTWTSVAPMPSGRDNFSAAVGPDGRIYVLGGVTTPGGPPNGVLPTEVDAYTVVPGDQPLPAPQPGPTSVTRELAPMPTGRSALGATTSNGSIYAIGGREVPAPQTQPVGSPSEPAVLPSVEAYDPKTNTWATKSPLPAPRMQMAVTTGRDGRIYVMGGLAANASADASGIDGLSSVEVYDPTKDRWSTGKPLPEGRYGLAAVTGKNGNIYAVGGATHCDLGDLQAARHSASGAERQSMLEPLQPCEGTQDVSVFNPRTHTWKSLASLREGRMLAAAAVAPDGRIYVLGGMSDNGDPLTSVESYDPKARRWTLVAPMPHQRMFGLAAATGSDGRIYVIGGCPLPPGSNGGYCGPPSAVDVYDPGTNTWTTVGSTLNARSGLAAATGPDGRVYAVGGMGDGNGKLLEVIATGSAGSRSGR